ncbi:unnamed protein product [Cyclocybe aegerita]|uniref:Uncharacterized protein n=1 Tax=Cyclocybe aegerita TaxID=1973307 RepID=A0A8S0WBZ4_CYCAE|nr:unnamed protein product [Cyclocybe aegerita]
MPEPNPRWSEDVSELGDTQCIALLEKVAELKRQRDSIVPIGWLPNEILSSIFASTIVWDVLYNSGDKTHPKRTNKHLIHASHAVFDAFGPRSKNAPLTVKIYNTKAKEYRHILQFAPWLKRLHIDFERPDRLPVEIRYPFPIVEAILVSPMPLPESSIFYRPETCLVPFLVGKKPFSNQAPLLRELVIAHEIIHLVQNLSVFSKIMTLILLKFWVRESKALKLLLEGITSMQYLERLELKECTHDVAKVEKLSAIKLPNLRCLHISGHLLGYARFIGHLSAPQQSSVDILSLLSTSISAQTQLFINFLISIIGRFPTDTTHIPWSMLLKEYSVNITYQAQDQHSLKNGPEFREQLSIIIPQVASCWLSFNIQANPPVQLNESGPFFDAMPRLGQCNITSICINGNPAFDNLQGILCTPLTIPTSGTDS